MRERIEIDINTQQLRFYRGTRCLATYSISSAAKGLGERMDSEQTPRGGHYVRAKIGADLPVNAILRGRRFSGAIYSSEMEDKNPGADWILTRILWLCGTEVGRNRLGRVDSMARYIYIHGTPDSEPMGIPRSHGCIRMRNADIIDLFDRVPAGCPVNILG